ncbi:MAG: AbrB/MazE/SpoVT family DNA-binding domain-containing protein [Anaerolineaceae bacterium]
MTYATIKKWGNSLAIRIPQAFASQIGVEEDSNVSLEVVDDRLIIKRRQTLDEMLANITEENKHQLVDFGGPQGKVMI